MKVFRLWRQSSSSDCVLYSSWWSYQKLLRNRGACFFLHLSVLRRGLRGWNIVYKYDKGHMETCPPQSSCKRLATTSEQLDQALDTPPQWEKATYKLEGHTVRVVFKSQGYYYFLPGSTNKRTPHKVIFPASVQPGSQLWKCQPLSTELLYKSFHLPRLLHHLCQQFSAGYQLTVRLSAPRVGWAALPNMLAAGSSTYVSSSCWVMAGWSHSKAHGQSCVADVWSCALGKHEKRGILTAHKGKSTFISTE